MEGHGVANFSGNHTAGNHTQHQLSEGGFLSGRNPFEFNPAVPLPTFIIQLVVIVCMSRIVKLFLSPIKQPAVIAETISGIILGPTCFGHIPNFSAFVFPKSSLPFLNLMSNFGLVLFLFLVGLELDPRMLKKSMKNSLLISLTGMALPFGLGVGVSYILYSYIEPPEQQTGFTKYFLFLGVAMAITAFPVLARILTELNLLKTRVGSITISAAAVDDATSWCLLALVISLINAGSGLIALYVFLMGLGYSLFLVFVVRPIFIFILRRSGAFDHQPSQLHMFLALMIVFISAFITDAIGIHAIFGGFLAGIIMPHESGFAYHITEKLEDIVAVLFLPLYFALSGLRTSIGSLDDGISWGIVVLVICAACFGKIFGCTLAARVTKMNWRESFAVGCLMNCKGLVELIVLNLGYDAGVISQRTFAIMVIMALVTTFITVPLVSFIYPPKYHDKFEDHDDTKPKKKLPPWEGSLLVSVNKVEQVPPILSIIQLLQTSRKQADGTSTPKLKPSPSSVSLQSLSEIIHLPGSCMHGGEKSVKITKPKKLPPQQIINTVRIIELTERDSSVMLQTSGDALKDDPVAKMFRTFSDLSSSVFPLQFRNLVKVVTFSQFGETLVQTARDVGAECILVPWSGSGSVVEEQAVRPIQQALIPQEQRRRLSVFTSTKHSNFIGDLLSQAETTVLVLVDRGLQGSSDGWVEQLPQFRKIYLPFFGGSDDREALDIGVRLSNLQGVQVHVIRYRNLKRLSGDSDYSEDSIVRKEHIVVETDPLDDAALADYFGTFGTKHQLAKSVQYSEAECQSPMQMSLKFLTKLSPTDLVLIGKGDGKKRRDFGPILKNSDGERRKVLGDFAEGILLCKCEASVLIVQSKRIETKL